MPTARETANADTFDAWARSGRGVRMAHGHAELVAWAFDRWTLDGARIVDVGCGVGEALAEAGRRGASGLAGIDVAAEMIRVGRERLPQADLRVGSAAALPWADDAFTHGISIESLYYHDDPVQSLRELARVVAPGGVVGTAIELYEENRGSEPWVAMMDVPMHRWSTARWRDAFEAAGLVDVEDARILRSEPVTPREAFTPSTSTPTWEHHRDFLAAGALWVAGRVPGR